MRRRLAVIVFMLGCAQARETPEAADAGASPLADARAVDGLLARIAATPHLRALPRGRAMLAAREVGFVNVSPLASGLSVTLPRRADEPVRFTLGEAKISITPEGFGDAPATLRGDAVVWTNAAPSLDLIQVVDGTTVEELRVLRAKTDGHLARWRVRAEGLTLRARERRLELVDAHGVVALGTAPIVAVDANGARIPAQVSVTREDDAFVASARFSLTDAAFPVVVDPGWSAVPSMSAPRARHTSTLLATGKVLVAGGLASTTELSTAEIYDPATKTWSDTGSLGAKRHFHEAVLLSSGKVLVAGGASGVITNTAELYDPASGTWAPTGAMVDGRFRYQLQPLGSGKFLAAGGRDGTTIGTSLAEIYDESTGNWTATASMGVGRVNAASVALAGGKVLVVGGSDGSAYRTTVELFDGASWTTKAPLAQKRGYHTATLLPSGKVLVVGGISNDFDAGNTSSVELYDPVANTWTASGSLTNPRGEHGAVLLSPTRVLIASGEVYNTTTSGMNSLSTTELYDVTTGVWAPAAALSVERLGGSMVGIGAGKALFTGGNSSAFTAEVYALPSLGDGCTGLHADACAPYLCVEGVCCDKACSGTCESCLASKKGSGTDGTCGFAADGSDPDAECASSCTGSTQTNRTCNGAGACRVKDTPSCAAGYLCKGSTCATTCSVDGDCAATHYCLTGACVIKRDNGATCAATRECKSGQCADGVCCDTACTGACSACTAAKKGTGADGTCAAIKDGSDPDKECSAASCSGTTLVKRSLCNGSGACRADGTVDCGATGYGCDAAGEKCRTTCTSDAQCAATHWCSSGSCVAKAAAGVACTAGNQCTSTFCADGVCCDKACAGGCEACTAALKGSGVDGTCAAVAADTDPKSKCAADSAYPTSCKADGACDGAGACRVYAKDTTKCGATTCTDGKVSGLTCNGGGSCVASAPKSCAPYGCGGDACKTTCAGDADCAVDAFCGTSGACTFKHANGDACSLAKECTSAFCVDGVCCSSACSGQCESCDGASKGTCAPVVGDPHGARTACKGDGTCKGTCDGTSTGTCSYPSVAKDCGTTCSEGKVTVRTCDGAGACTEGAAATCNGFACSDAAHCKVTCAIDGDCSTGYRCVSNSCAPATAKCSDDHRQSIDPGGAVTECGLYACEQATGRCRQVCTATSDCAVGNVCDVSNKQCTTPAPSEESSGGCSASSHGPRSDGLFWLGLVVAGLAYRRRQR